MTWGLSDIKAAYDVGKGLGATHMLVAWDSFDDNYPIYVMPGENPRNKAPKNGDSVDECYRYSLGWKSQSTERRSRHWEWDEPIVPEKKILDVESVLLHTKVYLSNGIMLPFCIPAREAVGTVLSARPEERGMAFISLSDLEEFQETHSFDSYMNFDQQSGQALIDAGWANMTIGHAYVATEEFRERNVVSAIYERIVSENNPSIQMAVAMASETSWRNCDPAKS